MFTFGLPPHSYSGCLRVIIIFKMPPYVNNGPTRCVEKEVSSSRKEIYFEGYFYDVTDWISRHPGGKIIEFYTKPGEDATLPIQQFHNRSLTRTLAIMKSLPKRKASLEETGLSSATLSRHKALDNDFHDLYKELKAKGFFDPHHGHSLYRFMEIIFLQLLGMYCISTGYVALKIIGIVSTALSAGRCGWWMHEGGHHSITGRPKLDRFIQSFVYGVGDGMSAAWWSSQHNRHHAMPQRLQHDVDLETLPLIAFNKRVIKKKRRNSPGFFIRQQSKLFALIDTFLVAMFWKLYLHPRYAYKKGAYGDLIFMAVHYVITLQHGITNYLLAVWLTSVYIFVNFSLSHTHLPVTDGPLHWVEYSFLHTVDIEPSFWCDWFMGYLNYQIEHHLFPTMPQFRHPEIRLKVIALAKKHNLPYHCMSYWEAMKKTFTNLETVSQELMAELH